jgi:hypothetical protein
MPNSKGFLALGRDNFMANFLLLTHVLRALFYSISLNKNAVAGRHIIASALHQRPCASVVMDFRNQGQSGHRPIGLIARILDPEPT